MGHFNAFNALNAIEGLIDIILCKLSVREYAYCF